MFGNILIDKLRFSVKRDEICNPYNAQTKLNDIMSKHFRKNNYTVNFDKCYFRITFTPTLYLDNVSESEGKPILNLEMMSEEKLLKLLRDIYTALEEDAAVTWIDFTKNTLPTLPVFEHIKALSKRQFKYPYRVNDCTSQGSNTSLILSPVKRSKDIKSRNTNRQICFYTKVDEVNNKTKVPFVDNVYLSDDEIAQIPETNYERATGRLWLNGKNSLNILRCEQRYKYTSNIQRITRYLTGSKDEKQLTLSLLIEQLEEGNLYKKLDEFYTNELSKYVFFDDILQEKNVKLNKHEEMVKDILVKYDNIDIKIFQHLFEEIEYKNQFKYSTKKVLYHITGKYYEELYNKFIYNQPNAATGAG